MESKRERSETFFIERGMYHFDEVKRGGKEYDPDDVEIVKADKVVYIDNDFSDPMHCITGKESIVLGTVKGMSVPLMRLWTTTFIRQKTSSRWHRPDNS